MSATTFTDALNQVMNAIGSIISAVASAIAQNASVIASVLVMAGLTYFVARHGARVFRAVTRLFSPIF